MPIPELDARFTFKEEKFHVDPYILDLEDISTNRIPALELEIHNFCQELGIVNCCKPYIEDPSADLSACRLYIGPLLIISRGKLRSFYVSWKHDLNRLRAFHIGSETTSDYPNEYKQAAYFAYRFSKVKPLAVVHNSPYFKYSAINERFAFHYATTFFLKIIPNEIEPEKRCDVIHQLYYRDTSPQLLSITFSELFERIKAKRETEIHTVAEPTQQT